MGAMTQLSLAISVCTLSIAEELAAGGAGIIPLLPVSVQARLGLGLGQSWPVGAVAKSWAAARRSALS